MNFEIQFYKDDKGNSQIKELLDRLKITNKLLWQRVLKGIEKLRNSVYHKEPLSKHLESGLWELRIRSKTDILRIIYTFRKGKVIILLHIFIKKQQKIPKIELEIARKRLREIRIKEAN